MTGYGHTTFYIKKGDFSFLRICQVLVRLNLLTVVLAYTMDTDYISYYFSPLVSMWFLIIYATMYVASSLNSSTPFVVVKILLSAALVTGFMSYPWLLEEAFKLLEKCFAIHWSPSEWAFRVKLDLWIVYIGMLSAVAYIKFRELRLGDDPRWPILQKAAIAIAAIVLVWYFGFELTQPDKFVYNAWHPYIAFLPVGAFIILRNASVVLRSSSSRMFAFIGTCSLETYIMQFHFLLAADTKGILMVIPGTSWRPLNLVLSSIMFIYLSHKVATATSELTNWICGAKKTSLPTTAPQPARPATQVPLPEEEIPLVAQENGVASKTKENGVEGSESPLPGERWVDRLASGSRSGPGFRMFKGDSSWSLAPLTRFGLGAKMLLALALMWTLNILWPS